MSARERAVFGQNQLSVGILSANLLRLEDEIGKLVAAGVELVHVDVMDGVFCPQLTVGPAVVRALVGPFLKDVHLMIDRPEASVEQYVEAGADVVTFHLEATRHPHRVLQVLAATDVVRGVAINPGTPVAMLEPLLDEVDYILLLGINPGWPGQRLIASMPERMESVRAVVADRPIAIGLDGGVTRETIGELAALRPNVIVAGSAVFDGNPIENASFLLAATRGAN